VSKSPVILTIAGSDSACCSGIQADIKTISALGGYAVNAITCITSQNTRGVYSTFCIPPEIVFSQLCAIASDFEIDAVKIGMFYNLKTLDSVCKFIDQCDTKFIIIDPVFKSSMGDSLINEDALPKLVNQLFFKACLVTPNLPELVTILRVLGAKKLMAEFEGYAEFKLEFLAGLLTECSDFLWSLNMPAFLVKGGHMFEHSEIKLHSSIVKISDFILSEGRIKNLEKNKIQTRNTRGTGCSLSSAIATNLGKGNSFHDSVYLSQKYVHDSLISAKNHTRGSKNGPIDHFFGLPN
tara:strand:- start:27589 stop:28473 length:885 start_codon:yes stop_codon:yes gene_type:complete